MDSNRTESDQDQSCVLVHTDHNTAIHGLAIRKDTVPLFLFKSYNPYTLLYGTLYLPIAIKDDGSLLHYPNAISLQFPSPITFFN
ncbi:hypothetical protein TorRG33x02_120010 [Trema orientale]|uniref:Uncharacterized protein n=1 Tax=Trema orientale TaxID=63057 RepID=A0A2P5F341_TREOI|nr:hypothetical protein TorRG33x02_120010 [Trema orientale]